MAQLSIFREDLFEAQPSLRASVVIPQGFDHTAANFPEEPDNTDSKPIISISEATRRHLDSALNKRRSFLGIPQDKHHFGEPLSKLQSRMTNMGTKSMTSIQRWNSTTRKYIHHRKTHLTEEAHMIYLRIKHLGMSRADITSMIAGPQPVAGEYDPNAPSKVRVIFDEWEQICEILDANPEMSTWDMKSKGYTFALLDEVPSNDDFEKSVYGQFLRDENAYYDQLHQITYKRHGFVPLTTIPECTDA